MKLERFIGFLKAKTQMSEGEIREQIDTLSEEGLNKAQIFHRFVKGTRPPTHGNSPRIQERERQLSPQFYEAED